MEIRKREKEIDLFQKIGRNSSVSEMIYIILLNALLDEEAEIDGTSFEQRMRFSELGDLLGHTCS